MALELLAIAATAAGSSLIACAVLVRVARRTGFIDRPGSEAHKQQATAVPYGGGLGMAVGVALGLAMAWALGDGGFEPGKLDRGPLWPILLGAFALLLAGFADDRKALSPWSKLTVQLAICAAVVWAAGLEVDCLRGVPGLGFVAAWGWLVLCSNAFNLLDHADGLSGSVALVSTVVLLSTAVMGGDAGLADLWVALIGALAGFLVWNLPPARQYMGDAGALPLGYLVGAGTLATTFWDSTQGGSPLALLGPLLILAIPLFDTGAVVVKRIRRGTPILRGDRNHISHRLSRLGVGPRASLGAVVALHLALAASALLLRDADLTTAVVVLSQAGAVLVAVVLLETSRDHTR